MPRHFNTSGICFPEDHYMVDPLKRLTSIRDLIDQKKYFVLHAPRQTGKTTAMRALMDQLNAEGRYIALHFSCESANVVGPDFEEANRIIVRRIFTKSELHLPESERPVPVSQESPTSTLIFDTLQAWAKVQTKPIVLLIDEIDSLTDLSLISVLRQLRDGYQDRPHSFPHSVALIGLKDVRDYKVKVRDEFQSLGTASPFNIKDRSLTLRNFTQDEVTKLYQQHTQETGQVFEVATLRWAFHYSQGQPWLTNALARECVEAKPDRTLPILEDDIHQAKETIILNRETHLDSLMDKLREERIRRILVPIMEGELLPIDSLNDDLVYVKNLGLIESKPDWQIANPIYQEVIPRTLNYVMQGSIPGEFDTWLDSAGKLDWPQIWDQFLVFWREHGAALIGAAPYHEIAPHLVLMAYLQRIANAKGQIIREYAIGRKRMDLLVRWPYEVQGQRIWQQEAIELKVWKPTDKRDPLEKGLRQLTQYLAGLSLNAGTLIIFDRREGLPDLEDRVEREFMEFEGRQIQVIRG